MDTNTIIKAVLIGGGGVIFGVIVSNALSKAKIAKITADSEAANKSNVAKIADLQNKLDAINGNEAVKRNTLLKQIVNANQYTKDSTFKQAQDWANQGYFTTDELQVVSDVFNTEASGKIVGEKTMAQLASDWDLIVKKYGLNPTLCATSVLTGTIDNTGIGGSVVISPIGGSPSPVYTSTIYNNPNNVGVVSDIDYGAASTGMTPINGVSGTATRKNASGNINAIFARN